MHLAVLQFELEIPGSRSLKDKRRVVRSVKDRLHRHHQVSVAEVAALETWNLALLALAAVNRDGKYLGMLLDRIVNELRQLPEASLGSFSRQIIASDSLEGADDEECGPLWTEEDRRAEEPEPG